MDGLKIKEVIAYLKKAEKRYGNMPCVAASEDEGNSFNQVLFSPTAMKLSDDGHGNLEWESDENPNYICIN